MCGRIGEQGEDPFAEVRATVQRCEVHTLPGVGESQPSTGRGVRGCRETVRRVLQAVCPVTGTAVWSQRTGSTLTPCSSTPTVPSSGQKF